MNSKGGKERAARAAEKINYSNSHVVGSGDTALHHAQSAINLAKKHGVSNKALQEVETVMGSLKEAVQEGKERKPLKGESGEGHTASSIVETAGTIHTQITHLQILLQRMS